MEKDQLSRKLAVILHADVVGSTALVQKDEALAHDRIQSAFQQLSEVIDSHHGIAREIRGDALVAEFERASDAVSAATEFQNRNRETVSAIDDEIKPFVRIGISLGEVIVADGTITGAGVVLAQRLEQMAQPGQVVVQGSVAETVPDRFPFEFEYQGEQTVKGFEQPVRAYIVKDGKTGSDTVSGKTGDHGNNRSGETRHSEKPSIAVLPFTNMSNDPEQEFFSDGITEDIITELSRISALTVIARNSTFIYKGKAVDISQVGAELGVRYVLEGSVRKSGNLVRVTAQLIDASNNQHLWAERYDRELEDIFQLQDEIMREIVSALDIEILTGEQARFWSDGTGHLQAWEYFRQARDLFSLYKSENHPEIIRLLRKALEFDSEYSAAWHLLANCYFHIEDDTNYSDSERAEAKTQSSECLEKSIECDPSNPGAWSLKAMHFLNAREYAKAVEFTNKAVAMAPNHANIIASSAMVMVKAGQPDIAMQRIRKAFRLCPVYPMWFLLTLGHICRVSGNTDEAIEAFGEMVRRDADQIEGHIGLAGIMAEVGNQDQAKAAASEILRINPKFSVGRYFSNISFQNPDLLSQYTENLRQAGLPD